MRQDVRRRLIVLEQLLPLREVIVTKEVERVCRETWTISLPPASSPNCVEAGLQGLTHRCRGHRWTEASATHPHTPGEGRPLEEDITVSV